MKILICRLTPAFTALFCFAACETYGQVRVNNDSYRQAKVVTLRLLHSSEEAINFLGATRQIEASYFRKIKSGTSNPVEMKIVLDAAETAELKSEAFVQTDGIAYEVTLGGIQRSTKVEESYRFLTAPDLRTYTDYKVFGTLTFSPELWQKMMAAQVLSYRIYLDHTPYTVRVSPEAHAKLRLFDRQ